MPDRRTLEELDRATSGPVVGEQDLDALFNRIERSIDASPGSHAYHDRPSRRRSLYLLTRISAAAVVLILIGLAYWSTPASIHAPAGASTAVTLPDGSEVRLNAESRLIFRRAPFFGRSVELRGEGFFSVAKDEKPFVVRSSELVVTVLGTRFNVRSRASVSGHTARVSVEEGRVSVSTPNTSEPLILTEGESVEVFDDSLLTRMDVPDLHADMAWLQGDLVFRYQRFDDALAEASRRLGVTIHLNPDSPVATELAERRINVSFPAPIDAEQVLQGLSVPLGLSVERRADGIRLSVPEPSPGDM